MEWRFRKFLVFFLIISLYFVIAYKRKNPWMTPLMPIRFVEQIIDGRPIVIKSTRVPIESMSPSILYAVMAAEDQKFISHFGFDFDALKSAFIYNIKHKTLSIWGSTITQQTAKNLFLWQGRSIIRKGIEAYFTVLIELLRSKERILEVYLNIIEFGDGIYGIDQAAHIYFKTTPDKLSNYQSATLAAMLTNPRYYQDHLRSYVLSNRRSVINGGMSRLKRQSEFKTFIEKTR